MQWIKQNKLLFIALVAALAIFGWYGLTRNPEPDTLITSVNPSGAGSPTDASADQQLVATLLTLRAVTLSGNIFQDPAFQSLRDFGTTIIVEPVGRTNPFAPLGANSAPPTATSTARTTR